MPFLPTLQAFLEQSALLLKAYPETTRISTKYCFPTERPAQRQKRAKKSSTESATTEATTPSAPVAALVLRTFNPGTGVCLQYRTNKHQEVNRLMIGLGKLASGADVASLGLTGAGGGDVEMVDAPEEGASTPVSASAGAGAQQAKSQGKGKR
ncbi:hypothetical protein N7492_010606 [Penicillium capsulatum]|uniref:SRP9 domain-containing protein n=1 Tax=Penicillium capsulatum TaxID=69766 RepID=A0A9W9HQ10_9EURO|nr:hypothetical protein N7492_010606 [Penicillium capsulatum]KAJ6113105.1 hypothetical protein N7512_008429 [Penicillium capsulatum]